MWCDLFYDQCAALISVFCPELGTVHYLGDKGRKKRRLDDDTERERDFFVNNKYTCSLFRIQQDTSGGLPVN